MHLLVAFKGSGNSANRLVSALQGEKLFLTNSYAGLREDIAQLNGSFDVIYMFGLDKRLKGDIRPETCALLNGQMIFSRLDVSGLASASGRKVCALRWENSPTCPCATKPMATCCKSSMAAPCFFTFRLQDTLQTS